MGFHDHFSDASAGYAAARPSYPEALYEFIASAYSVQPAEHTSFDAASFDAVCVAQALHWFDIDAFHREAHRVLKPGGVFAAWGYDGMKVLREFDGAFVAAVLRPIAHLWPAQNQLLWRGYRDLPFPYERIEAPRFHVEVRWTLAQLTDYLSTWTAVKRYIAEGHAHFLAETQERLRPAWGGDGARTVTMPLHFLCGRHAG